MEQTLGQLSKENLGKKPLGRIEEIEFRDGVRILKKTYYLARIRIFEDATMIGRLFNLKTPICVGWEEHFYLYLIYTKKNKSICTSIVEDMYLDLGDILLDETIKEMKEYKCSELPEV